MSHWCKVNLSWCWRKDGATFHQCHPNGVLCETHPGHTSVSPRVRRGRFFMFLERRAKELNSAPSGLLANLTRPSCAIVHSMIENAFFVPLLPGKTEAARAFASTIMNERRSEFDNAQTTVTKENWYLQETPHGDFMIVVYTSPDPEKVHAALAVSEEPFDVWFREQILDITGIDISTPLGGLPTPLMAWSRS